MTSKTTDQPGLLRRFWNSVFKRSIVPHDDADRKRIVVSHLFLHFRPARVPEQTVRYTHTWGLGGMSLVLFVLLAATGVLLMFVYQPSPEGAHRSIETLTGSVFFGGLIRNIHYWSANLLVVVAALHLLRTYLTGAYYPPRQFNWVLGLILMFCVLLSNFTGYLMPWDQLSYWAITIVTGMIGYTPVVGTWLEGVIRGGETIGRATLVNFYAVHTTVAPVMIIVVMAFHFWRVRKAGGVVIPRSPGESKVEPPGRVLTLPNLLLREFSVALVLIATVMVLSLLFDAPLGEPSNPGMSPNPAKAPWYFAGFQELLLHFDPVIAVFVIPLLAVFGLVVIPYIRYKEDTSGVLMMSHRGRRLGLLAAAAGFVITPLFIVADEYWVVYGAWLPNSPAFVTNGLVPASLLFVVLVGFWLFVRNRCGASKNETVQTFFVVLATAFVILTVTGIWFRGPGMALMWPWSG